MTQSRVLIVAGESSGDLHSGNLLEELRKVRPGVEAFGVGGERLREAGLECVARSEDLAHMGLLEVVRELPRIRRIMKRLVQEAERRKPDLAILTDSPDFNLRLASRLVKLGIPVVLYVSPQLWAWRKGRVRVVRRLAREVLCVLPFEVDFYAKENVPARYVGHPLVDDFATDGELAVLPEKVQGRLALMPGSRAMEVRQLLPVMLRTLAILGPELVREAVLIEASDMEREVDRVLAEHPSDPRIVRVSGSGRRAQLGSCGLAWAASGTATLECALLDVPMVVGYRMNALTYLIAKALINVPHVALVNLIAEDRVVPELIQREWRPEVLANVSIGLLEDGDSQRPGLAEVRRRLGAPGASRCAAQAVCEHLDRA